MQFQVTLMKKLIIVVNNIFKDTKYCYLSNNHLLEYLNLAKMYFAKTKIY